MTKKILQIIETAYRATIEEQDDTVVWFTLAMRGGGADLAVVLGGSAVNYGVKGQSAAGLSFGARTHGHPPDVTADVQALLDKGVPVYVVEDDVAARGIERSELIAGLVPISRRALFELYGGFDHVWRW